MAALWQEKEDTKNLHCILNRNLYIRAFDRMLEVRKQAGLTTNTWQSGIDVYHWWMEDNVLPGQLTIDGENDW